MSERIVIYSALARLWGNRVTTPVISGTLEENGSGKLSDWDEQALAYIKSLGCTHLWLIGVIEHATTTPFEGIQADPEAIVKGLAGSPYAIRDYYDVAPALCDDPLKGLEEFKALVTRVHTAGLKLMIDFVPNHVARTYRSDKLPKGAEDFGARDNKEVHFAPDNNFYYFPHQTLRLPASSDYEECPARATGNDCFSPCPNSQDWYETAKLNYGVDYTNHREEHFEPIPNTWHKMKHILTYWVGLGVDGFRCDMVEMVPPAFWAWVIPELKAKYSLVFLAEVYQPEMYQAYLDSGFDWLYDKVGVYDCLKAIIRGERSASCFDPTKDIVHPHQDRMCYFLENHDEQRFTSDFFAPNYRAIYPALASLVLLGSNPYLHYFGGELGERGMDKEGFSGLDGRTSIFDYWSLACLRRLGADYRGAELLEVEQQILDYHKLILSLSHTNEVFQRGAYHGLNYCQEGNYDTHRVLTYLRYIKGQGCVLIAANFSDVEQPIRIKWHENILALLGFRENTVVHGGDLIRGENRILALSRYAPYEVKLQGLGVHIIHFQPLTD